MPILQVLFAMATAFFISYISIPSIVRVANSKNLYDEPDLRRIHKQRVPTLGGLAIYAGFVLSITLFLSCHPPILQFIVASVTVLFFIGIKDDILIIAPLTKLAGQVIAALIIIIPGNLYFSNLHGFWDIHEIPYIVSIVLTTFVIVVITNGFNLIDGIDGLAASIGMLTAGTYGIWFFLVHEYVYATLAFGLIGSLGGFFIYNVFGKANKIFMGDTGSLIIGFVISVLTIRFVEMNIYKNQLLHVGSTPSVAFGILIIPLFDVMRVMFIRFFKRRPIFKADKNHLHHQLLELGFNHIQTTLIILTFNLGFIIFSFYASQYVSIRRLLLLLLIIAMFLSYIPPYLISRNNNTHNNHLNNHKK